MVDRVQDILWETYLNGASDLVDGIVKGVNAQIAKEGNTKISLLEVIGLLENSRVTFIDSAKRTERSKTDDQSRSD